jgi:hypothetical protein
MQVRRSMAHAQMRVLRLLIVVAVATTAVTNCQRDEASTINDKSNGGHWAHSLVACGENTSSAASHSGLSIWSIMCRASTQPQTAQNAPAGDGYQSRDNHIICTIAFAIYYLHVLYVQWLRVPDNGANQTPRVADQCSAR